MSYADKKDASRYQNRWIATKYDRINLTVPKGQKAVLQEYAHALGTSVNGLIWHLIEEEFSRNELLLHQVLAELQNRQERAEIFIQEDINETF